MLRPDIRRREFLMLASVTAGMAAVGQTCAGAAPTGSGIPGLLDDFLALPGRKSAQLDVDAVTDPWRVTHDPDAPLFCGSAFKTFVLATYLKEVEEGRLSESEQLAIDDSVRSVGGGVFEHLTGTTQARIVLEAMIAHSDNTATDVALLRLGPGKVGAFISEAGLSQARIPDSTRRFFSYIDGYPAGVDMGWKGIEEMQAGKTQGAPRDPLNGEETMVCPASEFVSYYKRALAGVFFAKKETLVEFKRIQAMADAIALVVPQDTPAYLKGGSIDWNGFHCLAVAGQMIVAATPVTFCLTLNWTDADGEKEAVEARYKQTVAEILRRTRKQVLAPPT
ncbi:MAG TPA: serine hydrolase [Hyphomicrobium sp.]|nr:serine hydrolase [Hyphomicrobium sp.]